MASAHGIFTCRRYGIATSLRTLLEPIFDSYGPMLAHAGAGHLVKRSGCLYVYSSREAAKVAAALSNASRSSFLILSPFIYNTSFLH